MFKTTVILFCLVIYNRLGLLSNWPSPSVICNSVRAFRPCLCHLSILLYRNGFVSPKLMRLVIEYRSYLVE